MSRTLSVYQRALGGEFNRLQPELQEYFSLNEHSGMFGVGRGTFDVAGCPSPLLRPVFSLTARENAFFPEYADGVGFTIRNWAHLDPFGRPSLTARRELAFPTASRVFEDTTSWTGNTLVDYLGAHRRVATALVCHVTEQRRMRMVSSATRLFAGPLRLPVPDVVGAQAFVEQWWDREENRFRISANVLHRQLGPVLVYAGAFTYELAAYDGGLPTAASPLRWERRR
ncbi:DUF4166 domain-containing protein [Arthrobacter sp. JZ12]|uniref:DUF4166 domain-containing protein n=1 Tax=Arthrobacter sp. JZ12 TaxID=2654190 RepID=UPI002B4A90DE|nr:DUF4166 domain-containing protein [Arthrobacter sp. JZ12]WRH25416.1 DUF4166 domain-containing protein [Arthrobacter sp. JZ12]